MNRILWTAVIIVAGPHLGAGAVMGNGDSAVGLIDTEPPEVTFLGVDPQAAAPGELVEVTFSVSESLGGQPEVRVNGIAAQFVQESGGTYTYRFGVPPYTSDGLAAVAIIAADPLGNTTVATDDTTLLLDMPPFPLSPWPVFLVLLAAGLVVVRRRRRLAATLLVAALLAGQSAAAQTPVVSNVSFTQRPNGTGGTEIAIGYNLESPEGPCDVSVWLSKDAGADGFHFPAVSVTGDLDDVAPGPGKTILWDVAADYPNEYLPQAQIRVIADTETEDYAVWRQPFPYWIWEHKNGCSLNLLRMRRILDAFSLGSPGGVYPRLSDEPGQLMFREDEVYPDYLVDKRILVCPAQAEPPDDPPIDDQYYVYLGYAVMNDADVLAFADAYTAELAAGGDFSGDLPGPVSYGDTLFRMRDGIGGWVTQDINDPSGIANPEATIPVMFDWPGNHQQGWGGNVLFADGRREFRRYPSEFPMTETTITALAALAGHEPPNTWRGSDSPYTGRPFVGECRHHCFELGQAARTFSYQSEGEYYPKLADEAGRLMFTEEEVYPHYLTNPEVFQCPGAAPAVPPPYFDDRHYIYFGYLMVADEDVAAFADVYTTELGAGGELLGDYPATTSYGNTLYQLRNGVEGALITNINSTAEPYERQRTIPIMMEWPGNHEGMTGGHVYYMDGRMEWLDYPGEFPMTEATVGMLRSLANRTPTTAWAEPNPIYSEDNDPYGLIADCAYGMNRALNAFLTFTFDSAEGRFPRLSDEPGRLMAREDDLYRKYMPGPELLLCPGAAEPVPQPFFDDQHYVYFEYLMLNDADVLAFADAYAAEIAAGGDFSDDLPAATSYGDALLHLRTRISDALVTDPDNPAEGFVGKHQIPVIMEWPGNHEGVAGGHVVYMDGDVEWHDYPGEFPMTETAVSTLAALAGWTPVTEWAIKEYSLEHDPHKRALCAYNMQCLRSSMYMFKSTEGDLLPALNSAPNTLMFREDVLVPLYLHDLTRLNCPGSAVVHETPVAGDQSYCYLGYALLNDADVLAFAGAYAATLQSGGDFSGDLPATTSYGDAFYRLGDNTENRLNADWTGPPADYITRYQIPLLIEWPDNHGELRGGNVLYFDGHNEWLPYPGPFPMSETAINILTDLAARLPVE